MEQKQKLCLPRRCRLRWTAVPWRQGWSSLVPRAPAPLCSLEPRCGDVVLQPADLHPLNYPEEEKKMGADMSTLLKKKPKSIASLGI